MIFPDDEPNFATKEKLVEKVKERTITKYEEYAGSSTRLFLEEQWSLIDQMFRCNLSEANLRARLKQINRARVMPPVMHQAVMHQTAKQWQAIWNEPNHVVECYPIGEVDMENAEIAGSVIRADFEVDKVDLKSYQMMSDSNKFGNAFAKVGWDVQVAWSRRRVPYTSSQEQDQLVKCRISGAEKIMFASDAAAIAAEILDAVPQPEPESEEDGILVPVDFLVIVGDRPTLTPVAIQDLFADPQINDLKDQDDIIIRSEITWTEAKRRFLEGRWVNEDEVELEHVLVRTGEKGRGVFEQLLENRGMEAITEDLPTRENVTVLEHYFRGTINESSGKWDEDAWPCWWVAEMIGFDEKGVVASIRKVDTWDGSLPVLHLYLKPDDLWLYRFSTAEIVSPMYEAIAVLICQAIDYRSLCVNPVFKGILAEIDEETLNFKPGNIISVDRIESIEQFMLHQGVEQHSIPMIEKIESWVRGLTLTEPHSLGTPLPSHTTAGAAAQQQSAANAPIIMDVKVANGQFFEVLAELFLAYRTKYTTEPMAIRTRDGRLVQFAPEVFAGPMKVVARGVYEFEKSGERRQSIQMAAQIVPMLQDYGTLVTFFRQWARAHQLEDEFGEDLQFLEQRKQGERDPMNFIQQFIAKLQPEQKQQIMQMMQQQIQQEQQFEEMKGGNMPLGGGDAGGQGGAGAGGQLAAGQGPPPEVGGAAGGAGPGAF